MVLTDSHGISRAPCYLGYSSRCAQHFDYGAGTHYGPPFKTVRLYRHITSNTRQNVQKSPATPGMQRLPAITHTRFSLIRFRSPLLTEYLFLSVLRCFTSPRSLYPPYIFRRESPGRKTPGGVSPFGHPRINTRLSIPRGLSQIATSFFGSRCQGIHRLLLKT